jgi:hypothetical protein
MMLIWVMVSPLLKVLASSVYWCVPVVEIVVCIWEHFLHIDFQEHLWEMFLA